MFPSFNPKQILAFLFIFLASYSFAQQPNPFKSIGKKSDVIDISKGKYVEIIEKDLLERIGSVVINRRTQKIDKLLDEDSLYKSASGNIEQSRFLSVDPLTSKFAELSPYQYASNRPIDGIDLDGLEYATFRIYIDKNQTVTKIETTTDYELKNKDTKGPGIQYHVITPSGAESSNFIKNRYGIYQGEFNPQLPNVGDNFHKKHDDYSLKPIDETDASAKQHDKDYDFQHISGLLGVFDDKSSEANEEYIKRAAKIIAKYQKGENDDITNKPVTKKAKDAAESGSNFFKKIEELKKPATNKETNPNDPSNGGIM